NRPYAYVFTILLYLVIGPLYAVPRLATTSFEICLAPFVPQKYTFFTLICFNIVFFIVAFLLARKPAKLFDYIGRILNPLFLILLSILLIRTFMHPMGHVSDATVQASYQENAFFKGFVEGYNTLDALASLAFGIIIVTTDRKSTRLNSSHVSISYAVFCLKKKKQHN